MFKVTTPFNKYETGDIAEAFKYVIEALERGEEPVQLYNKNGVLMGTSTRSDLSRLKEIVKIVNTLPAGGNHF